MENEKAKFSSMEEGSGKDWDIIKKSVDKTFKTLPDRILREMRALDDEPCSFPIGRLEHCLQTATRAYRDGRDKEYVICALIHDIGDGLASANHADLGAVILKPFVSEKNYWMVAHHGIFQGYYFFHHLGLDRNIRDQYQDHPYYEYTKEFCHKYDQNAFDPEYKSMSLEEFEPMLREVFAMPKNSIYKKEEKK